VDRAEGLHHFHGDADVHHLPRRVRLRLEGQWAQSYSKGPLIVFIGSLIYTGKSMLLDMLKVDENVTIAMLMCCVLLSNSSVFSIKVA